MAQLVAACQGLEPVFMAKREAPEGQKNRGDWFSVVFQRSDLTPALRGPQNQID